MRNLKIRSVIALVILLSIAGLAAAAIPAAPERDHNHSPDVPAPLCDGVRVPLGNKVAFRAYALGVQIYRGNGTSWGFVEPVATLFTDPNYHEKVGIHYLGPTWESNTGSKVVAGRLTPCTVEPAAIPWLLLQTVSTDNTAGGLAPTAADLSIGPVAEVPYSLQYYFYRALELIRLRQADQR